MPRKKRVISQIQKEPLSFYDYLMKADLSEKEVLEWRGIPPGLYYNLPPREKLPRFSVPWESGVEDVLYGPTRVQRLLHGTSAENCLLEGPRGTGKSLALRFDAHMHATAHENWPYLMIRRKLVDLKKSHLIFMNEEMEKIGGTFNNTDYIAYYPNGSIGFFGYCERLKDLGNYLSSQFGGIYIDEMTLLPWDWITKITACARMPKETGLTAFVKGGTNPIGVGSRDVKRNYITKNVSEDENPEYRPQDYEAIKTTPADNPHLDWDDYRKRLGAQKGITRRAWLDGEWVDEGSYFLEYHPTEEGQPWHVIQKMPTVKGQSLLYQPWVRIYRTLDWGYRPDPAVSHLVAVLPNSHTIFFKERTWRETRPSEVAKQMKEDEKRLGLRVITTFADPSIFANRDGYSVGEIFESSGIGITKSINDRTLFGTALCDFLGTVLYETAEGSEEVLDSYPRLQILEGQPGHQFGCPELIRTLPDMQTDPADPQKLAKGDDHWVVSAAYFCIGDAPAAKDPLAPSIPRWKMSSRQFNRSFSTSIGDLDS